MISKGKPNEDSTYVEEDQHEVGGEEAGIDQRVRCRRVLFTKKKIDFRLRF